MKVGAKVRKAKEKREKYIYEDEPRLSIIVQLFNKKKSIKKIIEILHSVDVEEIIIIDDGSVDGSHDVCKNLLVRPNDFLIHCNDIYEVRTYDRAIRFAKGNIVCLLQDDDIPPQNREWIDNALTLFDQFDDLAVLGGRLGLELKIPDNFDENNGKYRIDGDIAGRPGVNKYRMIDDPTYIDPLTDIPLEFVESVNRAPMFIRRSSFLNIGGIDQSFAPFQADDVDLCIRMWQKGYVVGLYSPGQFINTDDKGGMRIFNTSRVSDQAKKNWNKIYKRYKENIERGDFEDLVQRANERLEKSFKGANEGI